MSTILISLTLISLAAEPEVDAGAFGRLMQGLHEPTRDLTFVYEGGIRAGDGAGQADSTLSSYGREYQGRYIYRSDGAALLDYCDRGIEADARQSHLLIQNLGGVRSVSTVPDLGRLIANPPPSMPKSSNRPRPSALSRPGSPDRILFLWYFQGLTDPAAMRYEFQGWEEVDGRNCLRVELDSALLGRPEGRDRFRMWIDMARGGHPLKVDTLRQGRVAARSQKIRLEQYPDAKGASVWLPASGQFESFIWGSKDKKGIDYYTQPVLVETYGIVTGSVVINRGLSDADLTLASNVKKYPEFGEFKGFEKKRPRPRLRTDPQGVQKRLDEALADADSRAGRLEASAPERMLWTWTGVASIGFPILGIALLALAGIWRWRAG
jgi:hypothetical protein